MLSRRRLIVSALAAAPMLSLRPAGAAPAAVDAALAALERRHGGRLGVAILDTGTRRLSSRRGDERFLMCSTHKLVSAGCILSRVDRGQDRLDRRIVYTRKDVVTYSPETAKHAGEGMTLGALCKAGLTLSDNTAANLMLDSFGGPPAWTAFARSLGDHVSRLDRREPDLNESEPGDPRDTTTPLAMLRSMQALVLGDALSPASRAQLVAWLVACKTGDKRLRSGIPAGWRAGDKTGSGGRNSANDIAVLFPPARAPILVTAYYTESKASPVERDAVLADVGRLAASL